MTQLQEIKKTRTRQEWAKIINADWRKSIESIIHTGRDLMAAKDELGHGAFGEMVSSDLDFSWNTANALMRIAAHPVLGNSGSTNNLPPSWAILEELSELKEPEYKWAEERGLIGNHTSLRSARALSGALRTPKGDSWGENRSPTTLPKPSEAREIARETGRFVAASDGRVYSGATEEEGAEASRVTQQTYGAIDAINLIAKLPPAASWLSQAPHFQLRDLTYESVEHAAAWLMDLATAMEDKDGE